MTPTIDYFHSLSKLSRDFGTAQSHDELLHLIVDSTVKTMKAKAAAIFLMEGESELEKENIAVAHVGLSDKYLSARSHHAAQ